MFGPNDEETGPEFEAPEEPFPWEAEEDEEWRGDEHPDDDPGWPQELAGPIYWLYLKQAKLDADKG